MSEGAPSRESGEVQHLMEVPVDPERIDTFAAILRVDEYRRLEQVAAHARRLLAGKTVWNITSAARGGGVAEMLTSLLPLARGAGVNVRWLVVLAEPAFFRLTKRIHNRLHGDAGDGGALGPDEHAFYQAVLAHHAQELATIVRPGEIVILHDPQTAGLAPSLLRAGATVVWRCHVGVDVPNRLVQSAWSFLQRYLEHANAYVFTRAAYVGPGFNPDKVAIIPPSIDVFAPKNQALTEAQVAGILEATGLVRGPAGHASFVRVGGDIGEVRRATDLGDDLPVPRGVPIVTQISRWDRLKDPVGLVNGFAAHVVPHCQAHLVVAGPAVGAVFDDPEGFDVLQEMRELVRTLPASSRERVHLACLPMEDTEENAAIVNALQRRASVVVQKSLAEGFGLTVAEAMWKERAIVASRVGGIQDQIVDGVSGILVEPTDLAAYGRAVVSLVTDAPLAARLGQAAHRRCRDEYLGSQHLIRYATLLSELLSQPARGALIGP